MLPPATELDLNHRQMLVVFHTHSSQIPQATLNSGLNTSSLCQDKRSRLLLTMIGLGRIPSGQTEDRDRPKSFRGVVGDWEGGLPVGVLVLRRRAQSIKDFFRLVCFCSDSERTDRPSLLTRLPFLPAREPSAAAASAQQSTALLPLRV